MYFKRVTYSNVAGAAVAYHFVALITFLFDAIDTVSKALYMYFRDRKNYSITNQFPLLFSPLLPHGLNDVISILLLLRINKVYV